MTSLPNLPTDNLYKFLFISGLTMILSGVLFGFNQYFKVSEKIHAVELSLASDSLEYEFILEDTNELYDQIKAIDNKTKGIESKARNRKFINNLDYKELILLRKEIDSLGEAGKPVKLKMREAKVHSTTTTLNSEFLNDDNRLLKMTIFISCLTCIVGYFLAKEGYNKWESLVQKPLDEKLKLEVDELKGKIENQK